MDINYYILERQKHITDEEEQKKMDLIMTFMKKKEVFFQMNIDTVYNIFDFLEIPSNEREEIYKKLISLDTYRNTIPVNRTLIDDNVIR